MSTPDRCCLMGGNGFSGSFHDEDCPTGIAERARDSGRRLTDAWSRGSLAMEALKAAAEGATERQ